MNVIHRTDIESSNIECIWLQINELHSKDTLIGIIYRPPDSPVSWYEPYENMIKCATDYNMNVVVAGDFNINLINQNADILGIMESYGLDQIVTSPTRVTSNTATIIDHIYVSDKSQVMETMVPINAMSDHYPVSVTLSQRNLKPRKSGHTVITYRNMNLTRKYSTKVL